MREVVVLCYHALSSDWPATLCVRPERFERQVEMLLDRGYRPMSFSAALADSSSGKKLAITFDDAFSSVRDLASPILERLGAPATVFAVTSFAADGRPLRWDGIDQWRDGPHDHELASMSWDELRALEDKGWEVGSHTRSHPRLTRLSDADVAAELGRSREECEAALGHACAAIAYPYGDVDARIVSAARDAGYVTGAALPARLHRGRPLEWPRIGVFWNDDLRRFRLKVSPSVRLGRTLLRR